MSHDSPVIAIDHLVRRYGRTDAVDGLSLQVQPGRCYGFFGRNGAGKTTTIKCLLNLLRPTTGEVRVFGLDPARAEVAVKSRLAYVPDRVAFYPWMTVRDTLEYFASFRTHWNRDIENDLMKRFGLNANQKASSMSKGQKTQLALITAVCPEPELLVLDDPALGLDPVARRSLLQSMLYVTRKADRTIFFSSHLLSDVERVADRIAVLDGKVLRADCSVETFRRQIRHFVLKFRETPPLTPDLPGLLESFRSDSEMGLTLANVTPDIENRLNALQPQSIEPVDLTLEDAFISYVGERGEKTFFMNGKEGK